MPRTAATGHRERRAAGAGRAGATTIQSVARALDILEAIADAGGGARLGEVSGRVGLNASTSHHLLSTLAQRGYVTQDPESRRFYLGPKVVRLGSAFQQSVELVRVATPWLRELNARSGELVHMGIVGAFGQLVRVAKIEGRQPVRVGGELWEAHDMHCTALGKAILAYLSQEEVRRLVPRQSLVRFTERTLTGLAGLRDDLGVVRRRGYAVDEQERYDGVCCVGAPIRDQTGRVIAAASLSMPATRFTPAREAEVAALVKSTCSSISAALGHEVSGSTPPFRHDVWNAEGRNEGGDRP